jgi:hypothetical protein
LAPARPSLSARSSSMREPGLSAAGPSYRIDDRTFPRVDTGHLTV